MGAALVKQVFTISRVGAVAGCQVIRGSIERGCRIRVNRDSRTIGDYAMESLRREKDDVKEVARGMECGIKLAGFNDIKEGDVLEAYKIEEVAHGRCSGHDHRPADYSKPPKPSARSSAWRSSPSCAIRACKNVTVVGVEVAPDMKSAKVHVSIMGDEKEQQLSLSRTAECRRLPAEEDRRPRSTPATRRG